MRLIFFDQVDVFRGGTQVLRQVNLEVASGEKVGLRGPSGSGKSTILLTLLGAFSGYKGVLQFQGQDVCPETISQVRQAVAYIGQEPVLGAETVRQALLLPFDFRANSRQRPDEDRLCRTLADLGLGRDILTRRVADISGGEKQRLAVARALLLGKRVFLCDEITSALDSESRELVWQLFSAPDFTILSVSHDDKWLAGCDRVLTVKGGTIVDGNEV